MIETPKIAVTMAIVTVTIDNGRRSALLPFSSIDALVTGAATPP